MTLPVRPAALVPAAAIALAALVSVPLGTLRGTFLLVIVLPPMAHALVRLGWTDAVTGLLARVAGTRAVVLAAYALWLAIAALLGLDVAAVVAVPVGLQLAARGRGTAADHVGAAICGSNVGSMLFPFSNLTSLLVVAASGVSFGAFVRAALLPQLAAALAVGVVLWLRVARSADRDDIPLPASDDLGASERLPRGAGRVIAGVATLGVAAGAPLVGLAGGDVAVVFAAGAALVCGAAVAAGVTNRELARTLPVAPIAIVIGAAAAAPVARMIAGLLPTSGGGVLALVTVAAVGGLLASVANNLPAAFVGSVWLRGAPVSVVIAYLIGTNILAVATPHGSVATMLCRSLAARGGVPMPAARHLRNGWRYAVAGGAAACAALIVIG